MNSPLTIEETHERPMTLAEQKEYWEFQYKWGWLLILTLPFFAFISTFVIHSILTGDGEFEKIKLILELILVIIGFVGIILAVSLRIRSNNELSKLSPDI